MSTVAVLGIELALFAAATLLVREAARHPHFADQPVGHVLWGAGYGLGAAQLLAAGLLISELWSGF